MVAILTKVIKRSATLMEIPFTDSRRSNLNNSHPAYIYYIIIIIVSFFTFFINNEIIPADLMEARNLATAQEMVREGNYLLPTMNGELRIAKPPLPTWIAAGIEHICPGNLVVQRCMTGAIATLMTLFLFLLVSRLTRNKNIALISSLVLATSFNILIMGRTATWDIYCHSFMLGAIYFMVLAFSGEGKQWKNFILAGIFIGLSFLGKGPVSFYALLLPFLISYFIVYHPSARKKALPIVTMVVVFLFVSFWWMAYVYIFHADMALGIAQQESSSWLNHNVRPWYYYWQFPAEAGIWALFLVTAIVYFFVYKKQEFRKEYKFSIIWFISSLVLLSIIPEKKTRYLLPILIPGAISIAFYIFYSAKGLAAKGEKLIFRINACLIAVIMVALPIALYIIFYEKNEISLPVLILSAVLSWALAIYMFKSLFGKKGINVIGTFSAIVLFMMMVAAVCLIPIGQLFINPERHSISLLRDNQEVRDLPFYYIDGEQMRMELVYEADRTISPLNISDSLSVRNKLPFVILSGKPVDSIFQGKNIVIKKIDTFDNNWRKPGHKRYNWELVREVAILQEKEK